MISASLAFLLEELVCCSSLLELLPACGLVLASAPEELIRAFLPVFSQLLRLVKLGDELPFSIRAAS